MTADIRLRRRAVYTGLKPYLPADEIPELLEHWEEHYSDAPRFKLQGFVAEVCRRKQLRERRADILLSLVQAMNMPPDSLLADPHGSAATPLEEPADTQQLRAFGALFGTLLKCLDGDIGRRLQLDMLASLRRDRAPAAVLDAVQGWLAEGRRLRPGILSVPMLQALVNRSWVLLTEYLGPVLADRLLHQASEDVRRAEPALADAVASLL